MVDFKDRIRELMVYFNISQADIVNKTGISKSLVSAYVSGNRSPRQDKIEIISNAYGVGIPWLMGIDNANMFDTDYKTPTVDYYSSGINIDIVDPPKEDVTEKILKMYFELNSVDRETVNNMIEFLSKKGGN